MPQKNLVYILDEKIYINLTNKCTNDCIFCIRKLKNDVVGTDMWLTTEDYSAKDVIEQLEKYSDKINSGITFCGYGEPTIKFEILKEVAKYIKTNYPNAYIKINTNGHGNIINKKNILPELKNIVDEFSISLNAENKELYNELCEPKIENAYENMLSFAKQAKENGFKTTMSVVTGFKNYKIDISECQKIAESLGAKFRNREWLNNGY